MESIRKAERDLVSSFLHGTDGRYAIFGAGYVGHEALAMYGRENVVCFVDNSPDKAGLTISGKPIVSFNDFMAMADDLVVVVASMYFRDIVAQLRSAGVSKYTIYFGFLKPSMRKIADAASADHLKSVALYGDVEACTAMMESGVDGISLPLTHVVNPDGLSVDNGLLPAIGMDDLSGTGIDGVIIIDPFLHAEHKSRLQELFAADGIRVFDPYQQTISISGSWIVDRYCDQEWGKGEEAPRIQRNNGGGRKAEAMSAMVDTMMMDGVPPLFVSVEIETINRCNGTCEFCPVNRAVDPRPVQKMSDETFAKIIRELAALDYAGYVGLYSNNEPFLDASLPERLAYARRLLPKAYLYLYTNGTLLTIDLFSRCIDNLDEMIIDNYSDSPELLPPIRAIYEYCLEHPEYKGKLYIHLRNPHEVLTSRAGESPNREKSEALPEVTCAMPFQQLVIRPDGKVSLCCNDALGKVTLGDVTKESLRDVWYGENYQALRNVIRAGRKNHAICRYCDTVISIGT